MLQPQIAATLGTERFLREISVAARLTHPLILPLLDSGEVDGLPYFVMPYVQGETLTQRLQQQGALDIADALALARDVADALDYAHAVGIVHRDIKPDNILLLAGHAMIADFGIARAMYSATEELQVTSPGMAVGTPTYISPEQATGEEGIDGRSDLYSLAAVLYEMLAGVPPFTGPNAVAVIAKRFLEKPRALSELRPEVPAAVEQIVARSLQLDPASRPATAAEFMRGLLPRTSEPTPSAWRITMLPGTTVESTPVDMTPDDHASIAVIPFVSMSEDPENEYLCDGVTEEIIDTLSRLRRVRVVARASSFTFKNTQEDARKIGARLGVANILEGSVRRTGDRLRISARLVQVTTGFQLWSERFDRQALDLVAVQDEIGQAIAETLEVALLGNISRPMPLDRPSTGGTQNDFLEEDSSSTSERKKVCDEPPLSSSGRSTRTRDTLPDTQRSPRPTCCSGSMARRHRATSCDARERRRRTRSSSTRRWPART